jgi:hypothetical protein
MCGIRMEMGAARKNAGILRASEEDSSATILATEDWLVKGNRRC